MDDPVILDARGLLCPLPVLKARKVLNRMPPGACLRVLSDDPASVIDMPHFCAEAGHTLLEQVHKDEHHEFLLRHGQ